MRNLIIPCCGNATRYPSTKPKWMLTHPYGTLMVHEAVKNLPLDQFDNVYMAVLSKHLEKYRVHSFDSFFRERAKKFHLIELEESSSQVDTVRQVIRSELIEGSVFIKDCDNIFSISKIKDNCVYVLNLEEVNYKIIPSNKSYVFLKDEKIIDIQEKKVSGKNFCVGGYSFKDAIEFTVFSDENDVYISDVIRKMIKHYHFTTENVSNYCDFGTEEDWLAYKNTFKTLFIDIDGVLLQNGGRYFEPVWGNCSPLEDNIEALNKLKETNKCQVILTTSRDDTYRRETEKELEKFGIKYDKILFGLWHSQRIIVNDFSSNNPYPSCRAINLKRNGRDLRDYV